MSEAKRYVWNADSGMWRGDSPSHEALPTMVLASDYDALADSSRVSGMREKLLDNLLRAVIGEMEADEDSSTGDAPGHCHSVPGIWDEDNREKAGKQCAWCLLWAMAKQAVSTPVADGAKQV